MVLKIARVALTLDADNVASTPSGTNCRMDAYVLSTTTLNMDLMTLTLNFNVRVSAAGDIGLPTLKSYGYATRTSAPSGRSNNFRAWIPHSSTADANVLPLDYYMPLRLQPHHSWVMSARPWRQLMAFSQYGQTATFGRLPAPRAGNVGAAVKNIRSGAAPTRRAHGRRLRGRTRRRRG